MNPTVSVFLPAGNPSDLAQTIHEFNVCGLDCKIFVLMGKNSSEPELPPGALKITISSLYGSDTMKKIALHAQSDYVFLYTKYQALKLGAHAVQRMIRIAGDTYSGMIYSDHLAIKDGKVMSMPVIEYQEGSLRDDFNFGSLLLFETSAFLETVGRMRDDYLYAGLYDLRLKISQKYLVFRIPEFLYTETELDTRKSSDKQFDYVDPKNRQIQIEMESACTAHLKETGAWLAPKFKRIRFDEGSFAYEATVIIPVKNRVKTIAEAIDSVLMQRTDFSFNLIVIDNQSTDGTSAVIESYCKKDARVIHLIPDRFDLGIGGCWNLGIFHNSCGKFAVQLDSDDLYIDENVLSRIVEAFYKENCAMIVGSYRMVNFKLEEIPPGIIDHKEWTPDNGRNNALRINGLGAPRAFYTPVIRNLGVPNVSYGEDYALGLSISRNYQIGRIYDPLYLCRRWEENSDASLDVHAMNQHNFYKDKIRTIEYKARQKYIQEGQEV